MNFCRRCGAPLDHVADNTVYACSNGHTLFSSPAPTAGVFFVSDTKEVTLAVRGREPGKGMLDTPGGFVDTDETFEEALARELAEELGLNPGQYDAPVYLCSAPGIYPYQAEERSVLSVIFISRLKPGVQVTGRDDVADVVTIPLSSIDTSRFSGNDIQQAFKVLQSKLM